MNTTDVLRCVGCASFFLLTSAFIPLLGPLFCLLTPLPFLFYSTKLGLYDGAKLAALTTLIIALVGNLTGHPQIIVECIQLSFLGLALSELFKKKLGLGQTIFIATVIMAMLNMAYLFYVSLSSEMGPFEMFFDILHGHLKEAVYIYEKAGMSAEKIVEFETYGKAIIDNIMISIIIVMMGFSVWLNVVMARPFFRMGKLRYPEFIPMDSWKTPEVMIWGLISSGFAFFFLSGVIKVISVNVIIVLMFIYLFQGVSIVLFFLNKYHMPPWVRICVYFLIVVQQPFPILLALAGLFDQWADFRKLNKEPEPS